jgi:uncharacterized protein (TIGR04255 family)
MMNFDPMLMPLLHTFSEAMRHRGFSHSQDLSHPSQTGPYGVIRRFRRDADSPFPLMQIGPGIFAANESSQYEWKTYKDQVIDGVRALLTAYPTQFGFSILPIHLELRYVDVFDKAILGSGALLRFTETGTSLGLGLPKVLDKPDTFWGDAAGRMLFQRNVRGRKDTIFAIDIASGHNTDTKQDVIQLFSRVTTTGAGVPRLKTHGRFIRDVGDWLEQAHNLTSPFFKEFVLPGVMEKFKVPVQ